MAAIEMALWAQILVAYGHGVDPRLLDAIAVKESQRNPVAISAPNRNGTRDYGAMQINDANFGRFGLNASAALDPRRSVDAAARHLIADAGPDGVKPEVVDALYRALVHYNGSTSYPPQIMQQVPASARQLQITGTTPPPAPVCDAPRSDVWGQLACREANNAPAQRITDE